jgi:hypothetical protein
MAVAWFTKILLLWASTMVGSLDGDSLQSRAGQPVLHVPSVFHIVPQLLRKGQPDRISATVRMEKVGSDG